MSKRKIPPQLKKQAAAAASGKAKRNDKGQFTK